MHIEVLKHNLKKDGEDDVYETVPAICLGVVQNYTLMYKQVCIAKNSALHS